VIKMHCHFSIYLVKLLYKPFCSVVDLFIKCWHLKLWLQISSDCNRMFSRTIWNVIFSKKWRKKPPNCGKNHDLQETDKFCKKRHKISQLLLNFRSINPCACSSRCTIPHVNLSFMTFISAWGRGRFLLEVTT
jgi:hypothetical protein